MGIQKPEVKIKLLKLSNLIELHKHSLNYYKLTSYEPYNFFFNYAKTIVFLYLTS